MLVEFERLQIGAFQRELFNKRSVLNEVFWMALLKHQRLKKFLYKFVTLAIM